MAPKTALRALTLLSLVSSATCGRALGPTWNDVGDLAARPASSAPAETLWQLDVMPYLWIAGISGSQEADGASVSQGESLVDTATGIDFAGMLRAEARTGDLAFRLGALYLDLDSDAKGPGGLDAEAATKGAIVDVAGAYRLLGDSWDAFDGAERGRARVGFVDALAGVRVMSLEIEVDFDNLGLFGDRETWVDPYVGARGRVYALDWLLLGGEATIGGFGVGSDLAYSLDADVRFVFSKSVYAALGYALLDVDYESGDFRFDAQIRGPWFGLGFVF